MLMRQESEERKLRLAISKFEVYLLTHLEMTKDEVKKISELSDQELLMIEESEG